ncbi:gamma-glutamyltransferase [Nonomuraea guangzhouensis]|uniref:Gamma-glutamyltransferase n=1 Tax=Nonomuraea guangzhouensis TaxID=1291555 RepID=A0ABW4GGR5_9ACTN|nr:gamma-glutamyltransferase [Nonomuraea guangzhouensis]
MSEVPARPSRPDPEHVAATGRRGMISTSHPAATRAGLAALRAGGSAVDAYLAAAAVQTVVEPTMTTLAGGLVVTVYDPATGQSRAMAGVGAPPAAEDGDLDEAARSSGRTVVTPGWVRGAHAAWQEWGRLAWSELFTDALRAAREGFVVDQLLYGWAFEYRTVAGRFKAGREVWFPDGRMFGVGEVLRQPALARTIEQLAEQGPGYFYEGDFARRYVETARAAGGRITLDDMAACSAIDLPLTSLPVAGGYELHTIGPLHALMLSLAHLAGPDDRLYRMMRIVEESWQYGLTSIPRDLNEAADAVSPEAAEKLLRQVMEGPPRPFDAMNMGTNAIVVADESGMIAYGTHSASSTAFGVGLMAEGVIVPRPITLYATPMVPIPAGWATSLLALRDGRPVFAAASPSISALQNVFQNSVNVLQRGMSPAESVHQPMFGASHYPSRRPMVEATIGEEAIAEVERRGLGVTRVSPWEPEMGSCQAIAFTADGLLHGVADPRRLGRAAGH